MRMIVWSRGQALAVLSMILGLTMGVTALLLWSPDGRPPEEDAVAAFAAGSLFTMDETPEATEEVVESPVYYDENTQAVEETSQIKVIIHTQWRRHPLLRKTGNCGWRSSAQPPYLQWKNPF